MPHYHEDCEYGELWPMPLDYTKTVARAIIEHREGVVTPIDGDAINRRKAEIAKRNHPSNNR